MDPSLKLDSDTTFVTNTVTTIDTFDNEIVRTVTNTITETINDCNYDELKAKSWRQLRHEKRLHSDSLKHLRKMYDLMTERLSDSLALLEKLNKEITKRLDDQADTDVKLAKEDTKQKKGSWFTRWMGEIWYILIIGGLVSGFIVARKFYKIKG